MTSIWPITEALPAGLIAFSLADAALECGLIYLLRRGHHGLWIEAGSPKLSLRGYVRNAFNARRFVMSRSDRERYDRVLSGYCWIYRAFDVLFSSLLILAPSAFLVAAGWTFFRK